jgi:hypothetical protein
MDPNDAVEMVVVDLGPGEPQALAQHTPTVLSWKDLKVRSSSERAAVAILRPPHAVCRHGRTCSPGLRGRPQVVARRTQKVVLHEITGQIQGGEGCVRLGPRPQGCPVGWWAPPGACPAMRARLARL